MENTNMQMDKPKDTWFYTYSIKTDSWGHKQSIVKNLRVSHFIFIIFLSILIIFALITSFTKVPAGHTCVVTTFGKVSTETLDSGIHIKAPWQRVIKMDNRVQKQTVDMSCFSSDIQEVSMMYTINYQISKKDASKIYSTIGRYYYDTVIAPSVTESAKIVCAKYTAESLIADRTELAAGIEKDLSEKLAEYNTELISTSIEDMDFTDAFTNAVEAKQVAQQNKLKAQTEAEQKVIEANAAAEVRKVNADAEAYERVTMAQAEAEANEKVASSLTSQILNKMYYEKWDGVLPQVIGSGNVNTILSTPNN